jgi:hypothetical protein
MACLSPSMLYQTGGDPAQDTYLHAVVVLKQESGQVIFHDPDRVRGGSCQKKSVRDFLDAWQIRDFTALVVQK